MTVRVCGEFAVPTRTDPKSKVVALKFMIGAVTIPVPVSGTLTVGVTGSSLLICTFAVNDAADSGVKPTDTVQVALGTSTEQAFDCENCAAFVPFTMTPLMVRFDPPVFLMVRGSEEEDPTATEPKARLVGLTLMT